MLPSAAVVIGRKSTLFLVYGYELERGADPSATDWKPHTIKGAALLPHLDEYVRRGQLLQAYDAAGDLRAPFGAKDGWSLTDGEKTIEIAITDPPRLYTLDTGYAFIVLGVAPKPENGEMSLAAFQDTAYAIVRAGCSRVASVPPQMKKWLEARKLSTEDVPLRQFLASLASGLRPEAPRGTPRTTAPLSIGVVSTKDPLDPADRPRLRLVHRSNQAVEPHEGAEPGVWRVSTRETCLFSSFGFTWVVTSQEESQFLADAPHMIRDRYVYKWLLVEHQRLCLLALATECADMSNGLDGSGFAEMRLRLLQFIATYNFRHLSSEERHDEFYKRSRDALMIDDLLAEVREEVVEIDTQLSARRAETLNHVLAFLTLVLTPVGIVCGIFQTDTVPGKLHYADVITPSSWLALFTHPPFLVVLLAATTGATVYTRIFGSHVVGRLLRQLVSSSPTRRRP
jgi:hypothetical protein